MKTFDATHESFKGQCQPKQDFILSNFNKEVTEDEFAEAVNNMPKHLHWSKGHSRAQARSDYKKLKRNFGLFNKDTEIKQ